MATVSGNLITRNYRDFRGVDFSNRKDEVSLYHSPDALNLWKNYKNTNGKALETRPDIELLKEFSETIFGLFFYTVNGKKYRITHAGTNLYKDDEVIYTKMAEHKSNFFVMNNILYIMDATNYLRYDGKEVKEVEGYIPETSISRNPSGGGTDFRDVNLLTGVRQNSFCADGVSKEYMLDSPELDEGSEVKVWVNDKEVTNFTVDYKAGKVTFKTAPTEPLTVGQDNVTIQFSKTIKGEREKILNCTLIELFDNRVFFSGNPNHPNIVWHCDIDNPSYCRDTDYYPEGTNDSMVKALISGNNALWVMKEPSQSNTTIFYHTPTLDADEGKIYPSTHSSINTGCVATGINFNDDICFFSERGMEAISGDVTTEQVIAHRSSLIDGKLLNESNYKDMQLIEYEGYLLVIVDNKVYLADYRQMTTVNDHTEYEWYYWTLGANITASRVDNGVLYLCGDKKIYTLTNNKADRKVEAYWCTVADEFKYSQYQKISNKKGCTIDMEGSQITVQARTDNKNFQLVDTYLNVKGYVIPRIKMKKWKMIQLKISSTKPFSLYSCTLEAYIGSYLKR
jgi:hypothetical protein